jgi:hypothetical protein
MGQPRRPPRAGRTGRGTASHRAAHRTAARQGALRALAGSLSSLQADAATFTEIFVGVGAAHVRTTSRGSQAGRRACRHRGLDDIGRSRTYDSRGSVTNAAGVSSWRPPDALAAPRRQGWSILARNGRRSRSHSSVDQPAGPDRPRHPAALRARSDGRPPDLDARRFSPTSCEPPGLRAPSTSTPRPRAPELDAGRSAQLRR